MASPRLSDYIGWLNIREFGATPGTDMYPALVRANTHANGAGLIVIPPGTYLLSADFSPSAGVCLLVSEGVTLTGSGTLRGGAGTLVDLSAGGLTLNGIALPGTKLTAGSGGWTAKRFVQADLTLAAVDSTTVIGVSPEAVAEAAQGYVAMGGAQPVTADAPLSAGDPAKVGVGGRVTKHTSSQTAIQATITGEASAFTQPESPTTLEVLQAADVAADRGRGIVIEGSNAGGVAVAETIRLDATDTTTPVAGATEFTKVSAVYTEDGNPIGAQDVTVRASGGGATVCTLAGSTSEIGADVPAQSQEAYCNELTITGPNSDTSYVTIVGIDSADGAARERVQLDGSSPSVVTTTTVWRYVERICLGEFTNAATGSVKTNSTTDTDAMKCGTVIVAASARGDDAVVLVKPNA